MRIPKITVVAFTVFLTITILVVLLPNYEINSIQNSIGTGNVADYKLTEAIDLWNIYKITFFQPASYIFFVITVILAIVLLAQMFAWNLKLAVTPKE